MTNEADKGEAWKEFWARQSANGKSGGGCLPERWGVIEKVQKSAWEAFLPGVPENAKVLDLATGDARVLRWMLALRPDLTAVGVDLAPRLPPPPPGVEVHPNIAMEDLPFPDSSFGAVTSQFGFEYGDSAKAAGEIARVLAPGGLVGLMVHRGDGPILEHNLNRRHQLQWALGENGVAEAVKEALREGAGGIDKGARIAAEIAAKGAKEFGQTSPAWEIPEAIRRACLMGRSSGAGSIAETIGVIETQAKNELGRIDSLAEACRTADARGDIGDAFAAHDLSLRETRALEDPSGRAIADFLTFS
ncbi:class I SAM-dependent methyltransferase [Qipengyuania aquimaris]|uniref:Class I SAM-dependent methyltransferase n=1 Tax=Qipengyuania aquimaris TaxID=255984 RepID=A0A9Q3RZ43_9SPHN|nr:class I SAM-dependent methyltransferase [Qipengyuania aquimaris]MBY6217053.1 class I SAM-dependent methyltransferase [Qipengyuania aquimaris]